MRNHFATPCSLAVVVILMLGDQSCAQLQQLANRVPNTANALVIINAKAAYNSPLAKEHGWQQQRRQAHQAGMIAMPAGAEWFVMAAEMDFEFMQPIWEIALAYMREVPKMNDVADKSGGRLDRFAGTEAVERPNDSYVVRLGPSVVGAMSPANRQHVIRWVRESRRKKAPDVSDYLSNSIAKAGEAGRHIVMALDLQGMVAADEISVTLAQLESLEKASIDLKEVAAVVADIEGIRVEIELQNPPRGRLSVDFGADIALLAEVAKPLLLEVLDRYGANIEELQSWSSQTQGRAIVLEGELSPSGLRRILSVLSGPVGPLSSSTDDTSTDENLVAEASGRYFQSITNYLNDLFGGEIQPQSLHQTKTWIGRYARKIEDLSDYRVDPELVAFGAEVVSLLNEIDTVLDRAERRSDLREANLYDSGRRRYGRYGAYGYYEKSYVTRDRQLVQTDEANRGLRDSQVIVDEMRALTAQTRKEMSQRYQRDF